VAESKPPTAADRCALPVAPGPGDDTDPATWPADALAALQAVIDASRATAGAAVRDSFDRAERQMTAAELVAFWNGAPLKAMATVGHNGAPHIAPVHAVFVAGRLRSTIYENALRRGDLRTNPHVALTTWGPHGAAAIVYGRAREIAGSVRETRPGASGRARRTVALEIDVTRIYAMKSREG
jgi:pyridoxamine 5'-phosphate oxidase-like protein